MRVLQENSILKKFLIVFITIIMISNFIMPNYVHAKSAGETLVSGLFHLLAYLGDAGIKIMQYMMVGTDDIGTEANPEIKYSPGLIFSGSIAMLDINFINPSAEGIKSSGNMSLDVTYSNDDWNNNRNVLEIGDLETKLADINDSNYKTLMADYLQEKGYLSDYNNAVKKEYSITKKFPYDITMPVYTAEYKWENGGNIYKLTLSIPMFLR